jgi:predicted nucleic acid-binding protein
MKTILIDNCCLLDLFLESRLRHKQVIKFLESSTDSPLYITATTAERLYYQLDLENISKVSIDEFVNQFNISEVNEEIIQESQRLCQKSSDLEDAIEVAVCQSINIDIFLTADKKLRNKIESNEELSFEVILIK